MKAPSSMFNPPSTTLTPDRRSTRVHKEGVEIHDGVKAFVSRVFTVQTHREMPVYKLPESTGQRVLYSGRRWHRWAGLQPLEPRALDL